MMHVISVFAAVMFLLWLPGCAGDDSQSGTDSTADLIVIGQVHTMDAAAPTAAAIAVRDGRLTFVGDAARARALLRPGGRTIELAPGQMVLPGLVDSHVHMLEGGVLQLGCPIEEPKTKEELETAIRTCAADQP